MSWKRCIGSLLMCRAQQLHSSASDALSHLQLPTCLRQIDWQEEEKVK